MKWGIVTVATTSHLAGVAVLAESLREHHPTVVLCACLVEGRRSATPSLDTVACFSGRDCFSASRDWARFAFQYPAFPLAAALKPRAMRHALQEHGFEAILFLDSDILVTGSLGPLLDALTNASIAITPHRLQPFTDQPGLSRLVHGSRMGVYNSGIVAVRNDSEGLRFLDWWAAATETECIHDPARRVFVDQSWLEFVPPLFPAAVVCRHPGVNVGYWNLDEREVVETGDGWRARDLALCTFHFSGLDPANPDSLSRYVDPRFDDVERRRGIKTLARTYAAAVRRHGYDAYAAIPYAFQSLSDGTPIEPAWRELVRRGSDAVATIDDPFDAAAIVHGVPAVDWYRRLAATTSAQTSLGLMWWRFKAMCVRAGQSPVLGPICARFASWRQSVAEARRWQ